MTVYTFSRTYLISLLLNFEFKSGRCKRWVTNLRRVSKKREENEEEKFVQLLSVTTNDTITQLCHCSYSQKTKKGKSSQ